MPHNQFFNSQLSTPNITKFSYSKYGNTSASVTHSHSEDTRDIGGLRACITGMELALSHMEKTDNLGSALYHDQMITITEVAEHIALDTQRIAELKLGVKASQNSEAIYPQSEDNTGTQRYLPQQPVPSITRYDYYRNSRAEVFHNHPKNPSKNDLPKIEGCIAYMRALQANMPLSQDHGSAMYHDGMVTRKVVDQAIEDDLRKKDELESFKSCEKDELRSFKSYQNDTPTMSNISMQVLGGFIAALGIAAVAVAFVALNAATFGVAGLIVAGLGAVALLGGVGLFATGSYKNNQEATSGEINQATFF